MKLVVGLGNPGDEYNNTRHNIGFIFVDNYCKKNNYVFKEKFNGLYSKVNIFNETVIFLKPLSFMNLSGTVVKKFVDYYKIELSDILVIHDDLDIPVGKIKLKYKGSSGGHNGIKNIISELQSEDFNRFKVGISKNDKINIVDYVLGKFSMEDKNKIDKILEYSNNIIDDFIRYNFEKVMSKYNGKEYEII